MVQKMRTYTKEDLNADAKYYSGYLINMTDGKTLIYGAGAGKRDLMKDPKLTEGGKKALFDNKEEASKKLFDLIKNGGVTEKTMSQFRDYLNSKAPVAEEKKIVPAKIKQPGKEEEAEAPKLVGRKGEKTAETKPPEAFEEIVDKTAEEMATAKYKPVENSKMITVGGQSVAVSKFTETIAETCKKEAAQEVADAVKNKPEDYKLETKDMSFFQRVGTFLFGWLGYMPMDSKKIAAATMQKTAEKTSAYYTGEEFTAILRENNMVFNKNDSLLYEKKE